MKLPYLPILLIILVLNACSGGKSNNSASKNTDTLAYTYHTVKQRATDCGDKPDSGCTVAIVKFPAFNKMPLLEDSVKNRLFNLFWVDSTMEADTDLQKYANEFVSIYDQNKDDPNVKGRIFVVNSNAKVLRQDSSLTTLEIGGYMFQGGAHGATVTSFLNWNTKANRSVTLSDIFISDYKSELTAIAETIFRSNEKLSSDASLAQDYFFKDNIFALNNNFLITPAGIRFLYNQYEIKPFAAGQTNLFISYTKIKHLLRPGTVIAQYIK